MAYFAYHRTSTEEQNLDRGIKAIHDYAQSNGIVLADLFTDKCTGKNFQRPEYNFLRNRILAGDVLIISEVDRLGRNKQGILEELRFFKERGVRIMILEIPTTLINIGNIHDELGKMLLDTITNMLIEMYATFAEAEMHKRERRQREGIEAKKARGEWDQYGRPLAIDPKVFLEAYKKVSAGQIRPVDCMKQLGISKGTYYRYKNNYI